MSSGLPIFIFSRMSSSRLPGKALRPLCGDPLLAHVVRRCAGARFAGPVVVATSDRADDEPIVDLARSLGVAVCVGELDDVAARAIGCARTVGAESFVRISGDSPFIDPALIDQAARVHEAASPDLTTNVSPRTCPPGLSVEVVKAASLARALAEGATGDDREHVTRCFYRQPERWRIERFAPTRPFADGVSLTVDTAEDLVRLERVAGLLGVPIAQVSAHQLSELLSMP